MANCCGPVRSPGLIVRGLYGNIAKVNKIRQELWDKIHRVYTMHVMNHEVVYVMILNWDPLLRKFEHSDNKSVLVSNPTGKKYMLGCPYMYCKFQL